jgi:16S rRNA processing protein RimM
MQDLVVVGVFGKVFGIRGWIKVNSFTIPKENILKFDCLFIHKKNSNDVEKIHFNNNKIQDDNIIVKLPGYDSPKDASYLVNSKIYVLRKQLPKLKDGEYYWIDLIGLTVINKNGDKFGIVSDILATGSNDVLVVMGKRKHFIPYISQVICKVDLVEKILYIDWDIDF